MISIIQDHRTKEPHYPWEFSLEDVKITFKNSRYCVTTPQSIADGLIYEFNQWVTVEEFLEWFKKNHNSKFAFMRNFSEIRNKIN